MGLKRDEYSDHKDPHSHTHTLTDSDHARLQVTRHLPADALLNVTPTHLLVLLED